MILVTVCGVHIESELAELLAVYHICKMSDAFKHPFPIPDVIWAVGKVQR